MISPAELYNLLSDETRLRCLMLLHAKGELCVCELTSALKCTQPKVSRHLSMLRKSGIVSDERRGQWVYYRLNPILEKWVKNLVKASFDGLHKVEPFVSDIKTLKSLRKSPCYTPVVSKFGFKQRESSRD